MSDPRFAALSQDPRYRLPNRKNDRTAADPRFSRLLTDQDFRRKARVDRYGRKIKLDEKGASSQKQHTVEGDRAKAREKRREAVGSDDESDDDDASDDGAVEEDEEKEVVSKRDPARKGGFSASESEEETTSDEEDEAEAQLAEETAGQEHIEDIPVGEVTARLAAVNMDWDNLRAMDIMAVAASFVPSTGRIEKVSVYPSEFGRERMQKEEIEGPPKEIFGGASSKRANQTSGDVEVEDDDDELSEEEESDEEASDERIKQRLLQAQANPNSDENAEFDTAALRTYQLQRLRYYYAVIACDSPATAKVLYDAMDGREYLSSANFFDLRFIPDDTSFDDEQPRDECTRLPPEGYTPSEFRTEALMHSRVRLTWEEEEVRARKEVQRKAFSRGEMEEEDLRAYIASEGESSGAESVASRKSVTKAEERRRRRKEEQRRILREKLGLGGEKAEGVGKRGEGKDVVGDMQITFTSGLSAAKSEKTGVFENQPMDEESTRERYIRKERERKQKRKERLKATKSGDAVEPSDGAEDAALGGGEDATDAGFDDPFFTDPSSAAVAEKKARKAERKKQLAARAAQEQEDSARRKELELLMAEDDADNLRHFDMREIEKAEKEARRKGKKKGGKKATAAHGDVEDGGEDTNADFKVDSADPRFRALFESHEFAIDPTNPRFKKTEGMQTLLEEGRKKRGQEALQGEGGNEDGLKRAKKRTRDTAEDDDGVKSLVARLKKGKKAKS